MKANVLIAAYFIILPLTIVAQNSNGIAKISMLLPQDQSSSYIIHFQFLSETFKQLYSCLRYTSWRTCTGSVSSNPPPPFLLGPNDKYVASVGHDNQPVTFTDPYYLDCNYVPRASQIQCLRYISPCNTTGYFSFHLCNSTYCDPGCARIVSNRSVEIRQENTDAIRNCTVTCEQSTVTATSSQISTEETFPQSTHTTPSTTDSTTDSTTITSVQATGSPETNVPAIVGATIASLVVVAAIIAGVLLWKRKQASRKEQTRTQNGTSTLPNLSDPVLYNNQYNSNSVQNRGLITNHNNMTQSSGMAVTETEIHTKQSKRASNQGSSISNTNGISTENGYEVETHNGLPRHAYINNLTTCPVTTEHDAIEHHYEELVAVDRYLNSQPSPKEEHSESKNISSDSRKMNDVNYKTDKDTNEICNNDTISTHAESYYEEDAKRNYENDENNGESSSKTYYNTADSEGNSENCEGMTFVHNEPYYNYVGL